MRRLEVPRLGTTPEWLALIASVYFAGLCNGRFWSEILAGRDPVSATTFAFAASTFLVLAGAHLLILAPLATRWTVKPLLTVLLFANAFAIHFIGRYAVYLDRSMLRNVLETDAREAGELLGWGLVPDLLLYAALPLVLVWLVVLRSDPWTVALRRKLVLVAGSAACIGACTFAFYGEYSSFFQNHHEARYLITPGNYLVSLTREVLDPETGPGQARLPVGEDATRGPLLGAGPRPVLFVFVAGETARAASFSLNGYGRETNPELRDDDVLDFPTVFSYGTDTADSLPGMFSPFDRDEVGGRELRRYESLLDVLRRGGFRVVWRDNNSGCKGLCDGFETDRLDRETIPELCRDGECYDEVLLTGLDRVLTGDGDLFLVLHQKGSHGPAYSRRYPPQFATFQPACESADLGDCTHEEILNAYDNTILYTDHFLHRVIGLLAEQSSRYDTAMLYVSDHGESTGEGGLYLHGLPYRLAPDAQTHVPMVLWMSPAFSRRFQVDPGRLAARAGARYSHANLFHSVLGLLDVRTAAYRPERDLFVPGRDEREHLALTGPGAGRAPAPG